MLDFEDTPESCGQLARIQALSYRSTEHHVNLRLLLEHEAIGAILPQSDTYGIPLSLLVYVAVPKRDNLTRLH